MQALIRPIQPADDLSLAKVIHDALAEFDAGGDGFAGQDAEMQALSSAYDRPRHAYFVAHCNQQVLGGAGIAPLTGGAFATAELRKMYLARPARGCGLGRQLLTTTIAAAWDHGFQRIYLETLTQMDAARALYERAGFMRLDAPLGDTGHHGCNCWYLRERLR